MKERTTGFLQVTLKGKSGRADEVPTAVSYRIDCITTGRSVRHATAAQPLAEQEIMLSANDNTIINQSNETEVRRVTLTAIYGSADDRLTAEYDYQLQRVAFEA